MLYELPEGISILAKTIRIYANIFEEVNVVVREDDHDVVRLVEDESAICIFNSTSDQGLSQSIVAGVKSTKPTRAWLCALGDMPYVSTATVESMEPYVLVDNIVIPRTPLGNGNPVALGRFFRNDLLELSGDVGAKPMIRRHSDLVDYYDCEDYGIHQDIDQLCDIL